jgi:hypothetical protein
MRKLIVRSLCVLLALLVIGAVTVLFCLDSIIKKGVETVGPMVTQVPVKLGGASVSLLSGKGGLKGLFVGNPPGFATPSAIKVARINIAVKLKSVFSGKVIVQSVSVQDPEITYEGGLKGSNLSKILANVQAFTASEGQATNSSASAGKRIEVDDLLIHGAKIHLTLKGLGGKSATMPLPDIHLQNLGTGSAGITAGELTEKVMQAVFDEASKAAAGAVAHLGTGAIKNAAGVGTNAVHGLEKVTKGIGSLFRKQK